MRRSTHEQRVLTETLGGFLAPFGSVKVTRDSEGFSVVPGRFGRIEYGGPETDGSGDKLYVVLPKTNNRRQGVLRTLLAVPGVQRWQTGDDEARVRLRADDTAALAAVCQTIRARQRRRLSAEHLDRLREVGSRALANRRRGADPTRETPQRECRVTAVTEVTEPLLEGVL